MNRQLRMGGGIMSLQPRQQYGLGSFVKKAVKGVTGAVKGVAKGVKKFAKSDLGKAAMLAAIGFGIPGTQFGGLLGRASFGGAAPSIFGKVGGIGALLGQKAMTTAPFAKATGLQKFLGAIPGGGYTVGAIGSILAASGMGPEEIEATKRDPEKLKIYLRDYYSKTNPDASSEEVEQFVTTNTSEYAIGGRVGFNEGTNMKMASMDENEKELMRLVEEFMEQGFSQQEAIEEAKDTLERKAIAVGGRVGLESGTPKKGLKSLSIKDMDKFLIKGPHIIKYDEDGNPVKYPRPKGEPHRIQYDEEGNIKDLPKRVLLRNKSAMGGLQSMPMGQMRKNKAGTIERDYRETGGFVPVGIKEKADDVPAMLSKNEFVMTADAVRGMGGGNIEKGAQRLYDQMKQAEKRVV